jgi:hypothetical protein
MIHSDDLNRAILVLGRMRDVLFAVERASARRRTPGREAAVSDLDDLSTWPSADLEACCRACFDRAACCDRVTYRVAWLIEHWTEV